MSDDFAGNAYPNVDNFPEPSFPQSVPPPSVDPDEGDLISVSYAPAWTPVLLAAIDQLLNPFTWQGTHDEKILALNRASLLKDLVSAEQAIAIAPVWEDANGDDADAQLPASLQGWYGYMEGANFVDTLAGWVFLGQVAAVYGAEGAIQFATTLHNLRLFFRTADAGAIVRVLVDGLLYEDVDTYSATPGLTHVDLLNIASQVTIINTNTANPLATPNGDGNYLMAFVRKHIYEEEVQSPLMLRQNPSDSCQLQQSQDNGTTWTLAFDYSLCTPPLQQAIYDNLQQQQYGGWTGDSPTQINPNAPSTTWIYTTGDTSLTAENRNKALCQACADAVATACACYVQAVGGELAVPTVVAIVLGLAATIITIIGTAIYLPLGLAIAAAALEIYNAYVSSVTTAFASDPDNQSLVACLMYQTLLSSPVTQAAFQASLSHSQACWTADQNNLRAMVSAQFNSAVNGANIYHGFINSLGGTMQAIIAGATPAACPCDNVTWCHRFTPANIPASLVVNGGAVNGSVWRSTIPPSGNSYLQLIIQFYAPADTHVTNCTVLGNKDTSAGSNIYHVNLNTAVQECTFGCLGSPLGAAGDFSAQTIQAVGAIYTNAPTTELYFSWIQVSGTGVDPFGGCSNC